MLALPHSQVKNFKLWDKMLLSYFLSKRNTFLINWYVIYHYEKFFDLKLMEVKSICKMNPNFQSSNFVDSFVNIQIWLLYKIEKSPINHEDIRNFLQDFPVSN